MTQLLIQGSVILAQGPFDMDANVIATDDQIFPKRVIPGWSMVDLELPADFTVAGYSWNNGLVRKEPVVDNSARRATALAEIARLEGPPNYSNRGARELDLRLMEREAEALAAARGVTKEQVLASTPYYVKLKALDDQIAELRGQL